MLAAPSSGSGKTMITCGILQALVSRGLKAASFKCGPDYIDPMFHSRVIGTASKNLDTFFTNPETTRYLFARTAKGKDISVMEGVMGYYDGLAGISTDASSYDVAVKTKTPTILIVNGQGTSVSLLPLVKGFLEYQKDSNIKAVILNRVSPMIYPELKKKIESELPLVVIGYVPVQKELIFESRHLGLVTPDEISSLKEQLQRFANVLEQTLDLDALISIAANAEPLEISVPKEIENLIIAPTKGLVRIAIARDAAFCFNYEDNFELLKTLGAELIEFSPLNDSKLPEDIQGLWLCGGYPELYAKELAKNQSMKESILSALNSRMPCIAECGGFLYLHKTLEDKNGTEHEMVGYFPHRGFSTTKLGRFGYITLEARENTVLGSVGTKLPAHEFHYWESSQPGDSFKATKPLRDRTWACIHAKGNLIAGFPHLYLYGNITAAKQWFHSCTIWRFS